MDTKKTIQRKQLVVDPAFQYGLIIRFAVLVTIVLISSLVILTIIYNKYIGVVLPTSLETGGVTSFEITHLVTLSDLIWPVMVVILISITISSIAVYVLGLRFTHRIAGPVYRLRNSIAEMTDGDLGKKISIREKDYFQFLAADIDCLRQQLHDSVTELKTVNGQLNDISNEEQKELLGRSDTILSNLLKAVPS